jgi:hypothetical protein
MIMRYRKRIKLVGSTWTLDSALGGGVYLGVLDTTDESHHEGVASLRVGRTLPSLLADALRKHGTARVVDEGGTWHVERTGAATGGPMTPERARVRFDHRWGGRQILSVFVGGHDISRLAAFLESHDYEAVEGKQ